MCNEFTVRVVDLFVQSNLQMRNINILNNTNFRSKLERSKNIVKLIEFILWEFP